MDARHQSRRAAVVVLLLLGFNAGGIAAVQQTGERVYSGAAEATFVLEITDASGKIVGEGTGFLVAPSQILTNAHVANAGSVSVRLASLQVPCTVQRVDQVNDLAICEMAAKSSAAPIKLALTEPRPGATVFAIGNPRGLQRTISQGLFTGLRDLNGQRVAQISAAISPGSSGGPVLNTDGELIGVAVSSLVAGQTLNFAVPLAVVRDFIAGKQPVSDSTSLINLAKALVDQRDELEYDSPKWKELDAQLAETLSQAISTSNDLSVLSTVSETAGFLHRSIQVDAARKVLQIAKPPTKDMFRNLAEALYMATEAPGPSASLQEAEASATRAVTMGRGLIAADLSLLADIQVQANKIQEASSNYLKAAAVVTPMTEQAATLYVDLFRTSRDLRRPSEADTWFTKASAVSKRPAFQLAEYAAFLDALERYEDAAAAWMTAFQQSPKSARFVCEGGASYYFANDYDRALPAARTCLELASKTNETGRLAFAHIVLSDILHQRGVYEEAANHARETLAIQPENGQGHHYLARALLSQRRFTEAIASAKTAIRLTDGKYSGMHFTLGSAYFSLQQWPEAILAFTKASELAPTDSVSTYNVAVSYYNSRYDAEAIRWYRETLRREPNRANRAEILRTIDELSKR